MIQFSTTFTGILLFLGDEDIHTMAMTLLVGLVVKSTPLLNLILIAPIFNLFWGDQVML